MKKPRRMPNKPIIKTLTMPISLTLLCDLDSFRSGNLLMRFSDTQRRIMEGEKEVGYMGAAIGGTIFVEIEKRLWSVDWRQLWTAARQADAEYLKTQKKPLGRLTDESRKGRKPV